MGNRRGMPDGKVHATAHWLLQAKPVELYQHFLSLFFRSELPMTRRERAIQLTIFLEPPD